MTAHALHSPPSALRGTRALMALMGAVVMFGSIYFSAIAPPVEVDALDWAVAAWAFALAVALVVAAVRLGTGEARARRFAVRLLVVHFVFGIVKLVGYDEPEAATFMAVDVLLLALLSRRAVRARFSR